MCDLLLICDEQGKTQPRYPGLKVLFVQMGKTQYTENHENHT